MIHCLVKTTTIVFLFLICFCTSVSQMFLSPKPNDTLKTNRPQLLKWDNFLPNSTYSLFYIQNQLVQNSIAENISGNSYIWQVPLLDTTTVQLILKTTSKDLFAPILWWVNDTVVSSKIEIRKVFVHSLSDSFFYSTSSNYIEEWNISNSIRTLSENPVLQTTIQSSYSNDSFTVINNDSTLYYINRYSRLVIPKGLSDPHRSFIRDIAYSPNNDLLATASNDGTIKVRNLLTDQIVSTISVPTISSMYTVSFSNDGQKIVFAGNDGAVYIAGIATLPQYQSSDQKHGTNGLNLVVWDCNFSPDDQKIVSGGVDGVGKVWNSSDITFVADLVGQTFHIRATQFSPDNQIIATAGLDSTVYLFDAKNYESIYFPLKHSHALLDIQFFRDSKRVITVGRGSTVSIWQLPTETVVFDTLFVQPKYPISIFVPTIYSSIGERVSIPVQYSVNSLYPSTIDFSIKFSEKRLSFLDVSTVWKKELVVSPFFQVTLLQPIQTQTNTLPSLRGMVLFSQSSNSDSLLISKLQFANTFYVIDTLQNGFISVDSICIQNPLYPSIDLAGEGLSIATFTKGDFFEFEVKPIEVGNHIVRVSSINGKTFYEKNIDVTNQLDVIMFELSKKVAPKLFIVSVHSPTQQIIRKVSSE